MGTASERLLNLGVVVTVVTAITAVSLRIHETYFSDHVAELAKPQILKNWRGYASAGERMGASAAPVTIVEFSDFQCPFCRELARELRVSESKRPGAFNVVYRYFPLRNHEHAGQAALAAHCAGEQGAFETMHDALFSAQDSIGRAPWEWFATRARVPNLNTFRSCLTDTAHFQPILHRDSVAANSLKIQGTPMFLINALQVSGAPAQADLDRYIGDALVRKD